MTVENPKAIYACINDGEAAGSKEIERQAVYINGDIGKILGGSHGVSEFISIAVVVVFHRWKRQMPVSIAGGTTLYMLLIQVMF